MPAVICGVTYDVEWRHEPSRRRTVIFSRGSPQRYKMPALTFGVVTERKRLFRKRRALGLFVFQSRRPDTVVAYFNDDQDSVPTLLGGWSCLGDDAAKLVRAGKLDPVDAFWMTRFIGPPLPPVMLRARPAFAMPRLIDVSLETALVLASTFSSPPRLSW